MIKGAEPYRKFVKNFQNPDPQLSEAYLGINSEDWSIFINNSPDQAI
jgi:hypothetical protein